MQKLRENEGFGRPRRVEFGGEFGLKLGEILPLIVAEDEVRAVRPWRTAFRAKRALPSGVRGPVDCWTLD